MKYRSFAASAVLAWLGCGEVNAIPIDAQPAPSLISVMPDHNIIDTNIVLSGSNFGAAQNTGTVTVGGKTATIVGWSDTEITATVPDVMPGTVDVVVTTGGGATGPQMFRVVLPPRAYIHNQANDATLANQDTVSVMTFDLMATSHLAQMGTNVSIGMPSISFGGCDHSLVVHEATRRLFVTGGTGLAVFDIDPRTGALTAVPNSPFIIGGTADNVDGLEVNKAGTRAFVASYTGVIAVFDIATNGSATQVAGSPFSSPTIDVFALSENEQFLYGNTESSNFAGFSVSSAGALAALPGSPFTHGSFTFYMARQPHTSHLLLTGSNGLHVWNPGADGVPAVVTGSPFAAGKPASGTANGIAFTNDATHAYIAGQAGTSIAGVSLAADGTPTALPGSPYPTTMTLTCIAMSHDEKYIVATSSDASIGIGLLAVAGDGSLTLEAGSPYTYMATANVSGLAITF